MDKWKELKQAVKVRKDNMAAILNSVTKEELRISTSSKVEEMTELLNIMDYYEGKEKQNG